jgi:two-component system cell cycle response regulator
MVRDEPVRILIADDDLTSRLVLTGVLQKCGHDVVATLDGAAAWEAMQRPDAPTIAILDWMMPGLSGPDVCRRVRGLASDQPPYLILLTSKGEKADIIAGLEAGADDYLAKPFDSGELRARVEVGRRIIDLQVRLLEARDALAHEASHDPLTGALNRRAFAEVLSRALSEERRYHGGLALGICDLDEFKAVNDVHGHQTGDEVLVELVHVLSESLRGHDVLARHGGDEFVVLAGHVGDADVGRIFERMRAAVADHAMPTRAGDLGVTLSFGVSRWTDGQTGDDLLAAADAALYRAKAAGRNRVCLAGEPTVAGEPTAPSA